MKTEIYGKIYSGLEFIQNEETRKHFKDIIQEYNNLLNKLIIYQNAIYKLVGIDISDDDVFYILQDSSGSRVKISILVPFINIYDSLSNLKKQELLEDFDNLRGLQWE